MTMAQQTMTGRAGPARASAGAAPEAGMRIVGVLLALGVGAAHVADQGGVTAFTSLGVKESSWNKSHAMSRLSSEDYA
jgi:hypothetical protein